MPSSANMRTIMQYKELNRLVHEGKRVLFGSTIAANLPLYELQQAYETSCTVYNRSIPELRLADAALWLETCVFQLKPERVFLNLGEEDLGEPPEQNRRALCALIGKLRAHLPHCGVDLIPLLSAKGGEDDFNRMLQAVAEESGCRYLALSVNTAENQSILSLDLFRQLVSPFPDKKVDFTEVWSYIRTFC